MASYYQINFVEESKSRLFGEGIIRLFKKGQRHSNPRQLPAHAFARRNFHETSKKRQANQKTHGLPQERLAVLVQLPKHMGRTEKPIKKEKPLETSQIWEKLKELLIKKLRAEIDFSIVKMVIFHISTEVFRVDVEKF